MFFFKTLCMIFQRPSQRYSNIRTTRKKTAKIIDLFPKIKSLKSLKISRNIFAKLYIKDVFCGLFIKVETKTVKISTGNNYFNYRGHSTFLPGFCNDLYILYKRNTINTEMQNCFF